MNKQTHIDRYIAASVSFREVKKVIEINKRELESETVQNRVKITYNMLSESTKAFYSLELIERCVKEGTGFLVISVAESALVKMEEQAKAGWGSLSFVSKFLLGANPTPKSMSALILATHFNPAKMRKLPQLDSREFDIAMMVYGGLLSKASGISMSQ